MKRLLQGLMTIVTSTFVLYGHAAPVVQSYEKTSMTGNESSIVFYRESGSKDNIASVWVEDRIVGSLLPNRYAQTVTCLGSRQIRVDDRYGTVGRGSEQLLNVSKGRVTYVKVMDTGTVGHFALAEVDAATAESELGKLGAKSHVINRHIASCDTTYTEIGADALFDFDKSTLKPEGVRVINEFAAKLLSQSARPVTGIQIQGFTDRLGSEQYNERLSLARAEAVASQLSSQNVNVQIDAVGMGERYPVTKNCVGEKFTPELSQCLAPDRRVRIATKVAMENAIFK